MEFGTLYGWDANLAIHPQMAQGHPVEPDGRLWTITLRDGLQRHGGMPVLAPDCTVNIRRWEVRDALGVALPLAGRDGRSSAATHRAGHPGTGVRVGSVQPSRAVFPTHRPPRGPRRRAERGRGVPERAGGLAPGSPARPWLRPALIRNCGRRLRRGYAGPAPRWPQATGDASGMHCLGVGPAARGDPRRTWSSRQNASALNSRCTARCADCQRLLKAASMQQECPSLQSHDLHIT